MTFHGKRLGCGTNRMPTSVVYRGFDWLGQTDNQLLFCLPLIVLYLFSFGNCYCLLLYKLRLLINPVLFSKNLFLHTDRAVK